MTYINQLKEKGSNMHTKKLYVGTSDKAKNQKNFSLNLQVYERLFKISNTACGVPVSIPKAIEFLINYYESTRNHSKVVSVKQITKG
jgi:hypothetical protein